MSIRHAAALAVVGWYLMLAPKTLDTPLAFDESAPLSKWSIVGSYDSASDCNEGRNYIPKGLLQLANGESDEGKKNQLTQQAVSLAGAYLCIATDDPRLKGK